MIRDVADLADLAEIRRRCAVNAAEPAHDAAYWEQRFAQGDAGRRRALAVEAQRPPSRSRPESTKMRTGGNAEGNAAPLPVEKIAEILDDLTLFPTGRMPVSHKERVGSASKRRS